MTPTTEISFSVHARAVVRAVRSTFTDVLSAAGAEPRDVGSISSKLGLNRNLAWKVSRIIQAEDPSIVLEQMPGASGLRIFLKSVERAGVEAGLVEKVRQALSEYDRLIELHSGDRATLEMMGSDLSSTGNRQRDEHHRKLLFMGASYVWGVQARVNLKVGLVVPGRAPGHLDFASCNALIDFRRIRENVTWVMASRNSNNDDGTATETRPTEAIDPRFAGPDQAPLMGNFCSRPLPELRRVVDGQTTSFELVEGPVGNTAVQTTVVGTIQRELLYYRSPSNEWGEHRAKSDIPAELLIVDLFIHRSLPFALPPEASLHSDLGTKSHAAFYRSRSTLPLHEPVQDLGSGPLLAATPDAPQYSGIVGAMFERMESRPDDFHGYRVQIAYPAFPTSLTLRYPLPEAP